MEPFNFMTAAESTCFLEFIRCKMKSSNLRTAILINNMKLLGSIITTTGRLDSNTPAKNLSGRWIIRRYPKMSWRGPRIGQKILIASVSKLRKVARPRKLNGLIAIVAVNLLQLARQIFSIFSTINNLYLFEFSIRKNCQRCKPTYARFGKKM